MPDLPSLAAQPQRAPRLRTVPLGTAPSSAVETRNTVVAAGAAALAAFASWSSFIAATGLGSAHGEAWAAFAAAAGPLSAAVAAPLLPRASSRFSFRRTIPTALAVAALGAALCAWTTSAPLLAAARLLVGLAAIELALAAWLPAWVGEDRFARAAAAQAMGSGAGAVLGIAAGLLLGTRLASAFAAGALATGALWAALLPRPSLGCKVEFQPQPLGWSQVWTDRALRRVLADDLARGQALAVALVLSAWFFPAGLGWAPLLAGLGAMILASRARSLAAARGANLAALLATALGAAALALHSFAPLLAPLGLALALCGAMAGESAAAAELTHRAPEMRLAAAQAFRVRALWTGALAGALGCAALALVL